MNQFYIPNKTSKDIWYKEPWLLAVIAGPLIVVIASFVTFYLAYHNSDKVLTKDYYKQGLNINKYIEQDAKAYELQVHGLMQFNPQANRITFNLESYGRMPDSLQIDLSTNYHAAEFETTQKITLTRVSKNMYEGVLSSAIPANIDVWHLKVDGGLWRLTGDWVNPYRQSYNMKPQN